MASVTKFHNKWNLITHKISLSFHCRNDEYCSCNSATLLRQPLQWKQVTQLSEMKYNFILCKVKVKFPLNKPWRPRGEHRYSSTLPLTLVLNGGDWSMPCPSHHTPGKDPVTIVQEAGWALWSVWTGAEILSPPPGFNPQTIQPIASCYTDWAYPAQHLYYTNSVKDLTNFCRSLRARRRRWYLWQAGKSARWWQWSVRNQQCVGNFGSFHLWTGERSANKTPSVWQITTTHLIVKYH